MIEVHLSEEHRDFPVRVGRKLVGKVRVFTHGAIAAYLFDQDEDDNWKWLDSNDFRTLKAATNHILRMAGYGDCRSISVLKTQGFRS